MTDDKPGRIVSYDEDGAPIRQMVPEIACTCKCAPEEHGPNGCKTWYGDKNTGFRCNCDWRPGQDKMLIEAAAVNPNRPRGQVRYGPWRKVSSHGSKTEAIAAAGAVVGLYDVGIFHRGKRIVRERA